MRDRFIDTRKTIYSKQTKTFGLLCAIATTLVIILIILGTLDSQLSAGRFGSHLPVSLQGGRLAAMLYIGAAISLVFSVIYLAQLVLSIKEDDRRQFGVDPD